MKITRRQLKRIIKEELSRLNEADASASDVAEEATAWSTNEGKLIRLIVDSIRNDVLGDFRDASGALHDWVLDVYRSAVKTPSSWMIPGKSAMRSIIIAIAQAETKDEHINTIVRMFVDDSAGLTGPLSSSEGNLLRASLQSVLQDVEF